MNKIQIFSGYDNHPKRRHYKYLLSLGESQFVQKHKTLKYLVYSRLKYCYGTKRKILVSNLKLCRKRIVDMFADEHNFNHRVSRKLYPNLKNLSVDIGNVKNIKLLQLYTKFKDLKIYTYQNQVKQFRTKVIRDNLLANKYLKTMNISFGWEKFIKILETTSLLDIKFDEVCITLDRRSVNQVDAKIMNKLISRDSPDGFIFPMIRNNTDLKYFEFNMVLETIQQLETYFAQFFLPGSLECLDMRFDYWDWREIKENPFETTDYGKNFINQFKKLKNLSTLKIRSESEGHSNEWYPMPLIYQVLPNNKNLKEINLTTFDSVCHKLYDHDSSKPDVIHLGKILEILLENRIHLDSLYLQGNVSLCGIENLKGDYLIRKNLVLRGVILEGKLIKYLSLLKTKQTSCELWSFRIDSNEELEDLYQLVSKDEKLAAFLDMKLRNVDIESLKVFIENMLKIAKDSLYYSIDVYSDTLKDEDFTEIKNHPPHRIGIRIKN